MKPSMILTVIFAGMGWYGSMIFFAEWPIALLAGIVFSTVDFRERMARFGLSHGDIILSAVIGVTIGGALLWGYAAMIFWEMPGAILLPLTPALFFVLGAGLMRAYTALRSFRPPQAMIA